MIDPYLEAEYNNRTKVPGHPAVIAAWVRDAAAFRAGHAHAEIDLAYGPTPRQALDIFWPGPSRDGPLALFIHGGYWQGLDKSFASHLAAGLNAHGVAVAVPSYDLCPQASLATIVGQLAAAARFLRARHGRLDLATGHSAGGHLAAMLLADGLVPAALPISGLFDLRPLVPTSINAALGLDDAEAWRLSPLGRPRPPGRLHAVVGGLEGLEYEAQSRHIAEAWGGQWDVLAGRDHFTIPGELAAPASPLVAAAMALLS
jgi:arylformamidase